MPCWRWTARAVAACAIASLLILQLLGFACGPIASASGLGVAAPGAVCHPAPAGDDGAPPSAPGSQSHCALCPCQHASQSLDAAVAVAIFLVLAPPAQAAPIPARPGEAPPLAEGSAGAWSSRAPPLG